MVVGVLNMTKMEIWIGVVLFLIQIVGQKD